MSNTPFLLTFNNGHKVPIIGLGNWRATKDEACEAIKDAIDAGYRHFDTAFYYQNEKDLGRAFKEKIDEGKVKREDLFITSKLWSTFHRADLVEKSLRISLCDLGLDYLDLYLMHWPMSLKEDGELMPLEDEKPIPSSVTHFTNAWASMEECVRKGLVKSIGVSNFNKKQIETILKIAKIKPVTNQVECHPYFNQEKLREFCESKGILITAYAPLGSPYRVSPGDIPVIEDPIVKSIAEKYGKKPGQIILRYQVQRNVIVIPKSTNKLRIKENFEIFDFNLSSEDMERLNSLNKDNGRIVLFPAGKHLAEYPFNESY